MCFYHGWTYVAGCPLVIVSTWHPNVSFSLLWYEHIGRSYNLVWTAQFLTLIIKRRLVFKATIIEHISSTYTSLLVMQLQHAKSRHMMWQSNTIGWGFCLAIHDLASVLIHADASRNCAKDNTLHAVTCCCLRNCVSCSSCNLMIDAKQTILIIQLLCIANLTNYTFNGNAHLLYILK